jgi:PKD repeat protein
MIPPPRSARALIGRFRHGSRKGTAGQSLTELALVAPVLLLIVLVGIDFGRVYLGYINLQQMARIAASFAADNASAWDSTPDAAAQDRYQELVSNDARAINCEPPRNGSGEIDVFDPVFPNGFDLGDPAEVLITCEFDIITPIIDAIVGNSIELTATAVFPVREGAVGSIPGGFGGSVTPPVAEFVASPTSGYGPLEVTFVDTSQNDPTEWLWSFEDGAVSTKGPHTRTYECPVGATPGTTCALTAQLTVRNSGGFDSASQEIAVTVPPDSGPVAEFEATPTSGDAPLPVQFEFVDLLGGATVYTNWEWDFDSDGTFDATGETASHTYTGIGSYSVTLRVTDDAGNTNSQTKSGYITTAEPVCTVPDLQGVRRNNAQALWSAEGFTTTVNYRPGPGNYTIRYQSLLGGDEDPQPGGCDATITVGP